MALPADDGSVPEIVSNVVNCQPYNSSFHLCCLLEGAMLSLHVSALGTAGPGGFTHFLSAWSVKDVGVRERRFN